MTNKHTYSAETCLFYITFVNVYNFLFQIERIFNFIAMPTISHTAAGVLFERIDDALWGVNLSYEHEEDNVSEHSWLVSDETRYVSC